MGGTLGAILSIYFNALTSELSETQNLMTSPAKACMSLEKYTPARVGDRTIMDVLIPFAQVLKETESLEKAVNAAKKGAENTKFLAPVLGRATYVGREEGKELTPDPGAWGTMEMVRGLLEGYTGNL
jgi:triose/dihydroxyacetone kinase / FAD-AMP lyase (cyclizing)